MIFTPMSQEGPVADLDLCNQKPPVNQQGLFVPCRSLKTNSCHDETQQSRSTNLNTSDRQSTFLKDRHLTSKRNQADVHSVKNTSLKRKYKDEELDNSDSMDKMNKRKATLRAKMSKLLVYDRPSKLSPLPCGNSPASGREFKSPVAKKL